MKESTSHNEPSRKALYVNQCQAMSGTNAPPTGRPYVKVKEIKVIKRVKSVVSIMPIAEKEDESAPDELRQVSAASSPTTVLPIHEGLLELTGLDVLPQLRVLRPRFGTSLPSTENLIFAYTLASTLRVDEDEWQLFCMAPEWKNRKKKPSISNEDRENALEHTMRFLHGTGANTSVPVKQAIKMLRPYWVENVTPHTLYDALITDGPNSATESIPVRFAIGEFCSQLLAHQVGAKVTAELKVSRGNGRTKHLFEITGVRANPL